MESTSSRFRKRGKPLPVIDFELQPHLVGELLELRPLRPEDWDALFAVASDPLIWEQHPAWDRYTEPVFRQFFREAMESGGAFVILDRATGQVIGSSRYFGFVPQKKEIEIGWTFLARSYWGGTYNRELKRLMLDHAFRFVDCVFFYVGPNNLRSQRALEKIGASRIEGRPKVDLEGKPVEHAVYELRKPAAT
jgi:RimJ/RimL family protein N-acetyltransferase